ncbi:MAG TPA: TetR/AcrR family transcriptional regulator [Pseudomonadales bacterium]|nr:TetR/AcrR family transcriptional regulator [Pseudomonadales bacterium]
MAEPRRVRSSKGERTLQSIHDAARSIIAERGMAEASQENIAKAAGISQSTLRHYYPTKEELIGAIHDVAFDGYRRAMEAILLRPGGTPRERLSRLVDSHLENIAHSSDAFSFEAFAYLARNADSRRRRDDWYAWLTDHYAALVADIAGVDAADARQRAFQIVTLCLGAWVTLGKSRPDLVGKSAKTVKDALFDAIDRLLVS